MAGPEELEVLYDGVYVKPALGRRILLIVLGVTLGILLILLISLVLIIVRIRRQSSPSNEGVKSASTPGGGIFDARYSKVATRNSDEVSNWDVLLRHIIFILLDEI